MNHSYRSSLRLRVGATCAAVAILSACGGGGGSGGRVISTPVPSPTPTPSPVPTPAPTPTPTPAAVFDTAEFRRSEGPAFHNAVTAWSRGVTGTGSKIAIIDTGIDLDNPEFAGRIDPASADVAADRSAQQEDDHGTNVALVAAAARNSTGVVGIAYNSTIIALRADTPGSCAEEDPEDASLGCTFNSTAIAAGIDRAVGAGATVINLSLGGGGISNTVRNAVARAAARGVVLIVSAGNDGESTEPDIDPDQPDPFAASILEAGGSNVIIVGSVDDNGVISPFSNKAGALASSYLTARGQRICCVYENGELFITTDENGDRFVTLFSGTSFSAPQVSGAVALLKQAFPNLTGADIVSILLDSARDAGAAGADAIYGRGVLDIARAFAPAGATTLAGTTDVVPLTDDTGVASGPMGDALSRDPVKAVLLDKYKRAYEFDFSSRAKSAALQPRLEAALARSGRHVSGGNADVAMAFRIGDSPARDGALWTGQLRLSQDDAEIAQVLAARIAMKIAPDLQAGFAFGEGASGLVAQMQGQSRPAFLIAGSAQGDNGFVESGDASFALRRSLGEWGLTVSAQQGEAWLGNFRQSAGSLRRDREKFGARTFALTADRRFGDVEATLGLNWLAEDETVLGAYFHDALGATGADSLFVDASAGYDFAPGWRLGAAYRQGYTRANRTGTIGANSDFSSNAWSFDLARYNALKNGDSLGFRVSQPLRITGGGLNFELPVAYDYATESAISGVRTMSLAPEGSELMGELAWTGPLWTGNASASLFYRKDPGHYAYLPDDQGIALKWNRQF